MAARLAALAAAALALPALLVPALAGTAGATTRPAGTVTWTATKLPLPPGTIINSFQPVMIACSSAKQCVSGGSYDSSSTGDTLPGLLNLAGKGWTGAEAPLPADTPKGNLTGTISSAACPSATFCFAGGTYPDSTGNTGMILTWSAKHWSAARAPLPADAGLNPDATIGGISCVSAAWCTAAGQYGAGTGQYGLLLRWSGKKWAAVAGPLPSGAANGSLDAVSCPATTRCFAGGLYQVNTPYQVLPYLVTWSGGKWTQVNVPLPAGAATAQQAAIKGVSCPSVTKCFAVGYYQDSAGARQAFVLTWAGKGWTAAKAPLPANAASNPWASLNAISCVAKASHCAAGGSYEDSASQSFGLLLTWSGKGWTAAAAPAGAYALQGMSCPSATRCIGVSWANDYPEAVTGP